MSELEPDPDSPFAEFAKPKPSAVDYLKTRREYDRKATRERWLLLASLASTSALGAGLGATLGTAFSVLFAALGFALVGALLGTLGGWLMGAGLWVISRMQARSGLPGSMERDLFEGNTWDRLTLWLGAWGAICTALGSALGASKGANLIDPMAGETVVPWAWAGALLGVVVGFWLWQIIKKW